MRTRSRAGLPAPTELAQIIDSRAIVALFQPIVELDSEEIVGYEALARGPAGSAYAEPHALFAEAYRTGRVAELDWVCRAAAVRAALDARLPGFMPVFLNMEPLSLGAPCPPDLVPTIAGASGLRFVIEVTERSLADDPAGLLAAVARAREQSVGVALDDVGADPSSLAMMSLIGPDVIKLDLKLIQGRPNRLVARIVNAVLAEAERSGATIVGEGIESERHVAVARSMGATLGQGWYYGRPDALPPRHRPPRLALATLPPRTSTAETPYGVIAAHRKAHRVAKDLLLPMSMYLEYKGLDSAEPAVLLASFQNARYFGEGTRRRYSQLASRGILTAALGQDMPTQPGPGIRGGRISPGDPLTGEWAVVAIGPHFAGALVAKDCGDRGPDAERRFDFIITHDRDLVIEAAHLLLHRLLPLGPSGPDRPGRPPHSPA